MARAKTEQLQKHTLNLRAGDLARLQELFPQRNPTVIVRKIVSKFVDNLFQPSGTASDAGAESAFADPNQLSLNLESTDE